MLFACKSTHRIARRSRNVAALAARGACRGRAAAQRPARCGAERDAEIDKLHLLIQRLLRQQFGRRSEQLSPDQLLLGIEDLEQTVAESQAGQDAADPSADKPRPRRETRPNRNHGALPAHLPRYEVLIDVERRDCPCCGGTLHVIDEERSEQLDIVPAQLRVRVTRRPRYACRACEGAVVVAPAPERPIDGGMATEAMIAHVLVSKFGDSLPLYRQSKMLERQGITLDRSTLSHWVGRACWWLTPLYDLVLNTALAAPKLFADDTTLPVLDPGRGKTKTGRLWCYAVDDRPWRGPGHPVAAYVYTGDRKNIRPATPPERLPWRASGRRLCRVQAAGRGSRRCLGDARVLLVAHAAAVLSVPCFHTIATGRRGAGEDRRAVCHRSRDPRSPRRAAKTGAAGPQSTDCRGLACLVAGACRTCLGRLGSGRAHPLCAAALAGADRLSRRRPDRDGWSRRQARWL
jgi:transposase